MTANVIRLSERRPTPALALHRALIAWHDEDPAAHPLGGEEQRMWLAGFRGDETPPLVRAFLDGQLARMLGDLSDTPAPAAAAPLPGYDGAGF